MILVAEFFRNQAERVGIHGNGTARVGRGNCEGDIARVGRVAGRPPDDALSSPSGEGACGGGSATFAATEQAMRIHTTSASGEGLTCVSMLQSCEVDSSGVVDPRQRALFSASSLADSERGQCCDADVEEDEGEGGAVSQEAEGSGRGRGAWEKGWRGLAAELRRRVGNRSSSRNAGSLPRAHEGEASRSGEHGIGFATACSERRSVNERGGEEESGGEEQGGCVEEDTVENEEWFGCLLGCMRCVECVV